jgi:hypothetical protein
MTHTAPAPSYATRNHAPYIPPPSNPLAPWREDPLGAVALMVVGAIWIVGVGVASLI